MDKNEHELTVFDITDASPRLPVYKVFIGGRSAVGKTSLLRRYRENKFNLTETATLGVDFKTLPVIERDDVKFKVQLWDTSGEERFEPFVSQTVIENIHVMVYVFALDELSSLDGLDVWVERIKEDILVQRILVGNKSDLIESRQVYQEDIDVFLRRYNMQYFETSAKNGDGVKDLFDCIIEYLANETPVDAPEDLSLIEKPKRKKKFKDLFCCCCKKQYAEV